MWIYADIFILFRYSVMYYTTPAIILSSAPYREWGRSFLLLTKEKGQVTAHAVGAARMRSKLGPKLTPYRLLSLTLVSRFADRIIGVEADETFSHLWHDCRRQGYAAWGLAVLQGALKPGVADERIFHLCLEYLRTLNDVSVMDKIFPSLRLAFAARLLDCLGYRVEREVAYNGKQGEELLHQSSRAATLIEAGQLLIPMQKALHERIGHIFSDSIGISSLLLPEQFLMSLKQ